MMPGLEGHSKIMTKIIVMQTHKPATLMFGLTIKFSVLYIITGDLLLCL
jgi:hypothetical protein